MVQRLNSSGIDLDQSARLSSGTIIVDSDNKLRIYDGIGEGGNVVVGGGSTGDITFVGTVMELFDVSPAIITSNVSFFVNGTLTVNDEVEYMNAGNVVVRQFYNPATSSLDTVFS